MFSPVPSPYSPALLVGIERTSTRERLARYLGALLHGLLHELEAMVRNAAHQALKSGYQTSAWYDAALLSPYWRDQVVRAKARTGAAGKPGKVIAELTFGFWVDLVQASNHRALWVDRKLNRTFPNAAGKTRADIHPCTTESHPASTQPDFTS